MPVDAYLDVNYAYMAAQLLDNAAAERLNPVRNNGWTAVSNNTSQWQNVQPSGSAASAVATNGNPLPLREMQVGWSDGQTSPPTWLQQMRAAQAAGTQPLLGPTRAIEQYRDYVERELRARGPWVAGFDPAASPFRMSPVAQPQVAPTPGDSPAPTPAPVPAESTDAVKGRKRVIQL